LEIQEPAMSLGIHLDQSCALIQGQCADQRAARTGAAITGSVMVILENACALLASQGVIARCDGALTVNVVETPHVISRVASASKALFNLIAIS
jgi:hypothetical protein